MSQNKSVSCPGCSKTMRVSARVVSDGNAYWFHLCRNCEDVVYADPASGEWRLRGEAASNVPEVIDMLRTLAVETWRVQSTSREPMTQGLHSQRLDR